MDNYFESPFRGVTLDNEMVAVGERPHRRRLRCGHRHFPSYGPGGRSRRQAIVSNPETAG